MVDTYMKLNRAPQMQHFFSNKTISWWTTYFNARC